MGGGHPVNGALHLLAAGVGTALGLGVVGAAQLQHRAGGGILDHLLALDDVGVAQPHLAARCQPVVTLRGLFEKVVLLDIDLPGEGEGARTFPGHVVGVVGRFQLLHPALRIVRDHHPERVFHGQHPRRLFVQVVADEVLELAHLHGVVALGDAHAVAEVADGLRCVTPSSESRQGGHARVVPARDVVLLHEFQEPPLAHHRVVEIQPRELDLPRVGRDVHLFEDPVVELAVVLELQGAERVGDPFQRVRQRMGEVVHGIDGPGVAGVVVGDVTDAVDHGIAHLHVGGGHVDPGAQHVGAVGELPVPHAGEKVQVLVHTAAPVRALPARLRHRATGLADLRLAQAANVGAPALDEL